MFISTRRGTRLAAVAGLTAAVVVALAAPAAAAPGTNEAFGIRLAGPVVAGPFSYASFPFPGPHQNSLVDVDALDGRVQSGTVNTEATGTSASASVEDLSVDLGETADLNATAVSSECSYDPETASLIGSSSIVGGAITILGLPTVNLETSPAPNTVVADVPGVATIILNRQVFNPDGSLTVDAIYILLADEQEIIVATSHCHPEVLVIPVIAPEFAAGAGVLGLLALGFVLYRRRQSATDAA